MTIGAILALAALASCSDPKNEPVAPPVPPGPSFQTLDTKEAVLNNVEVAYNRRNIAKYDELLDADFVFFLATGDVGGGIPDSWGRADDILYNSRMFDPNYAGSNRCKRIEFDLQFENGVDWTDTTLPGYPGEMLNEATVGYYFNIDVEPDIQYQPAAGSQARFIVRNIGTDSEPQWRLVELHDLGTSVARAVTPAASSQETTWGMVKALYRD